MLPFVLAFFTRRLRPHAPGVAPRAEALVAQPPGRARSHQESCAHVLTTIVAKSAALKTDLVAPQTEPTATPTWSS